MKNLAGTWYNELGSRVELAIKPDGQIEGHYFTAVGGSAGEFRLTGQADIHSRENSRAFGFVVAWTNSMVNEHSVTVWSGLYHHVGKEEVLSTTWLLTRETATAEQWTSTLVGTNTFRRTPPEEWTPLQTWRPEPVPTPVG
jgi:hypothetical protein